jgi:hypothetical protein
MSSNDDPRRELMLSKKAQENWAMAIDNVEGELCDAETLCLVKDDDQKDVYRLLFNTEGLDATDGVEVETIYDEYDLRKRTDAARLVRNLVALIGSFPEELKELREGAAFAMDEDGEKGIPVLIRIIEGKRELPYIEIVQERLEFEFLEEEAPEVE